jgi:hypothetical protein
MSKYLFADFQISSLFDKLKKDLKLEVESYEPDKIRRTDDDKLWDYFHDKYRLQPVIIHFDQLGREEPEETRVDLSNLPGVSDGDGPRNAHATKHIITIPFEGDAHLLRHKPSHHYMNHPEGGTVGNEIRLTYIDTRDDGEALKRRIEEDIKLLKELARWQTCDIEEYNKNLPGLARQLIMARKDRLQKSAKAGDALGIPLRARPDTVRVVSPEIRHPLPIQRPLPSAIQEPYLEQAKYEHILKVLKGLGTAMERTKRTFAKMDEEELRDILLMHLNEYYEGQATGETFNGEGKTDILIRVENKNVFIAECKIWDGPQAFLDAVDQLFRYSTWYDARLAIVVFNRNESFSHVLKAIQETAPRHPCYIRHLGKTETTFAYTFHLPEDAARLVTLTVLAFNIPTRAA